MTKSFITRAFQKMGVYPMNVKLKPNKNRGENIGYAFVDLHDPVYVIHKLNRRYIPGANPVSCNFGFLVILFSNHKLVHWGHFF